MIENKSNVYQRLISHMEINKTTGCWECKYHEEEGIEMVYCPNMIGGWVENEWFCANGKRKGGAD